MISRASMLARKEQIIAEMIERTDTLINQISPERANSSYGAVSETALDVPGAGAIAADSSARGSKNGVVPHRRPEQAADAPEPIQVTPRRAAF